MIFNLYLFHITQLVSTLHLYIYVFSNYTSCFKLGSQINRHNFSVNKLYSKAEGDIWPKYSGVETVRGAQCYLPPEQRIQRWLHKKWDNASKKFGFQEYSMPVLTHTSVFANSITPMDDEHFKEMYTFNDKKGRNLSLRGDITPQFMNMIKSLRSKDSLLPLNTPKWYTIADCWRYERPSYCRRRNHTQWNVDIIGIGNVNVELDLISLLIYFYKSLSVIIDACTHFYKDVVGLTENDVKISLNHRDFAPELLKLLGIVNYSVEWYYKFCKLLDKYKKVQRNEFDKMLKELDLTTAQCAEFHKIIESSKNISDLDTFIGSENTTELKNLMKGLEERGHLSWVDIDLTIVRGNDYYTGIVFECFDRDNILPRSLAGGGRYDDYFNDSDPVLRHSAGFGMGNIAITNLLKIKNLIPESYSLAAVLLFTQNLNTSSSRERMNKEANDDRSICVDYQAKCLYELVELLRDNDVSVYHYYKTPKIKKAMRYAEKWMITFLLMPTNVDGKPMIMMKNLMNRSQEYFDIEDPSLGEKVMDIINKQL